VRQLSRSLVIAANFIVLSSPPTLQHWIGGDTRAYIVATLVLVGLNAWLAMSWRDDVIGAGETTSNHVGSAAIVTAVAACFVLAACRAWVLQILTIPHDPQRADMLIVVQQGLRRVLRGRNPYVIYHVPWEAPLPYGPMLWAPFAIPYLMGVDIRFVTVIGELFVPVAVALAAMVSAYGGRTRASAGYLIVLGAIAFNPDFERFASIGHTPAYWPLLALFAWFVVRERWLAASIAMGLLIVARTTMVAVLPVFLITVWFRDRAHIGQATALVAAAIAVPFIPFAVSNAQALVYALYGSYEKVMKGFVWTSTTWVQHTIGITGVLLSRGWLRWVEPLQIGVMLGIYGWCWRMIGEGRPPIPWMAIALLAFSMTTLWPVTYIYFDVFLLLAASIAIESGVRAPAVKLWTALLVTTTMAVIATGWMVQRSR